MPLNARLLTAGLLLLAAGLAGCASTSSGPSGAQQDAAELAAAPESSSGSPSADSTPTGSPSADSPSADSTPDASPAASSTESSSASADPSSDSAPDTEGEMLGNYGDPAPNTDVCDQGLSFACGSTGPGGGVVFYASSTAFRCGPGMALSCNFLEVAPNGWNGKLVDCVKGCGGDDNKTSDRGSAGIGIGRGYEYCSAKGSPSIPGASGTAIGSGYANTTAMVAMCNQGDAGELARGYTGGGMSDWSLPSVDELNALYYYPNRDAIGGFSAETYWSSSFRSYRQNNKEKHGAWSKLFGSNQANYSFAFDENLSVRPVRAF